MYQNPLLDNATVLQISIEEKGEFIASCCHDRAFIHGLLTRDFDSVFRFDRRVNCVAIDPMFSSKNSDRRIITGDDRELLLHSKNFFSKYTRTLIHSGDGKIKSIKWSPVSRDSSGRETSFIVFSTDHNVRIFDTSIKAIITVIKKDFDIRLDPSLIKCSIHFESGTRLLLSWGDSVKVIDIKTRPTDPSANHSSIHFDRSIVPDPDLPDKYAEIISMFHVNYNIAGISRFKSLGDQTPTQTPSCNNILLLVVDKGTAIGSTPQFMIMNPTSSEEAIEISSDILSTKGYQHYQCLDYHLESLICDDLYFIVCPKDVISVSPREEDDHISWLIERNRYMEALDSIKRYEDKIRYQKNDMRYNRSISESKKSKYSYTDIGKQYIDHLLFTRGAEEDILKAADMTPAICGQDIDMWNEIFDKFENVSRLRILQPYIPIGVKTPFKLNQEKYDAVITEFINHDPEGLLRVIEEWSVGVAPNTSPNKITIDAARSKASFSSLSSVGSPPTASSSFGRSASGLFRMGKAAPALLIEETPSQTPAQQQPLYDVKKMKQSLLSVLQFKSDSNLLRALAIMYQYESSYDEALKIYLKLSDSKRVFDLISKFDLFETLREKLTFFMKLNPIDASKLLIANQNKISVEDVIEKLKSKRELLHVYLDQVFENNPDACADHHDLLITLYVDHNPDKLLNMLKISNHYSLESAFKLIESKRLISEMVFLLSRMGNNKQALHYITDSLKDINRAINFCQEEDDIELWNDLITLSAHEPESLYTLLTNAICSTYIPDPILLIQSIPDKLIIKNLKSAISAYLTDFKIQINIQEKCKAILVNDCYSVTHAYVINAKKANNIHNITCCSGCDENILPKGKFQSLYSE